MLIVIAIFVVVDKSIIYIGACGWLVMNYRNYLFFVFVFCFYFDKTGKSMCVSVKGRQI